MGPRGSDSTVWMSPAYGRAFRPLPRPLRDNLPQPLALRYHGHQFRYYNPDLGDGRGFLFAQVRDAWTAGCSISPPGFGHHARSRRRRRTG